MMGDRNSDFRIYGLELPSKIIPLGANEVEKGRLC